MLTRIAISWLLAGCLVSCRVQERISSAFHQGFEQGQTTGYENGYLTGQASGLEKGKAIQALIILRELLDKNTSIPLSYSPPPLDKELIRQAFERQDSSSFNKAVRSINLSLIYEVVRKQGGQSAAIIGANKVYNGLHPTLTKKYFEQYEQYRQQLTTNAALDRYFSKGTFNSSQALGRVVSENSCAVIGVVLGLLAKQAPEMVLSTFITGEPCIKVLSQIVTPAVIKIKELGYIEDVEESRLEIRSHVSGLVAEMATVSESMTVALERDKVTRFLFLNSSAKVKATYRAEIKAGFNLKNMRLDFDHVKRTLQVNLGKPQILTVSIFPTIDIMEDGVVVKIDKETLNQMTQLANTTVIDRAQHSGITDRALKNAQLLVQRLLEPVASAAPSPYKILIM